MTRPTDDELEAMAQYHDWREDGDSQTADMLRACKGQDTWNAAIEAAAKVIDARKSVLEVGTELSDRVRKLKKGPANE